MGKRSGAKFQDEKMVQVPFLAKMTKDEADQTGPGQDPDPDPGLALKGAGLTGWRRHSDKQTRPVDPKGQALFCEQTRRVKTQCDLMDCKGRFPIAEGRTIAGERLRDS